MSNHITEQEAREAAALRRSFGGKKSVAAEWVMATNDLAEWAMQELSRCDAERSEREKPIDADWCLANGARHWKAGDEYVFDGGVRWGVKHGQGETLRGGVYVESTGEVDRIRRCVPLPSITTRGQLLDLLAALKGGAS